MSDELVDVDCPIGKPLCTLEEILIGPKLDPLDHIKLYDNEKFEEMIREWAYFYLQEKSGKYKRVQRLGGAGDRGRDVIGYLDTKSSAPAANIIPGLFIFGTKWHPTSWSTAQDFGSVAMRLPQVRTAIVKLAKTFPMRRLSDHCAQDAWAHCSITVVCLKSRTCVSSCIAQLPREVYRTT